MQDTKSSEESEVGWPTAEQQSLPFEATYQERFMLIEAVTAHRAGLTQRRWTNAQLLLKAIHSADRGSGCWASIGWLADKCHVSRRTLDRAVADAVAVGVLEKEHRVRRSGNGGRTTNTWRISWASLASLSPGEVSRQSARVSRQNAQVKRQRGVAIKESTRLSTPRGVGSSATEELAFEIGPRGYTPDQVALARIRGNAILKAVGHTRPNSDDWDYAAKVAIISVTRFGEGWLQDALEAVRRRNPREPWRYLRTVLRRSCEDHGHKLAQELAVITEIPDEMRRHESAAFNLRERLCVSPTTEDWERTADRRRAATALQPGCATNTTCESG